MGDAAHAKRDSAHNRGDAADVTHDETTAGPHGDVIAALALADPRTRLVIWNGRIWNRERGDKAWRPYAGANSHATHVHVEILPARRGDASPWPWSPEIWTAARSWPSAPDQT